MNKQSERSVDTTEKETFYKAICEEFPQGVLHERKDDALAFTKECREQGEKAYVRIKRMTRKEFESQPEI